MAELETQPGDEILFPSQQSGQFCLQLMLGDNLGDTAKKLPQYDERAWSLEYAQINLISFGRSRFDLTATAITIRYLNGCKILWGSKYQQCFSNSW